MLTSKNEDFVAALKIQVIGLGGAGTNVVDSLKLNDLSDVRLAAVNTDTQALNQSLVGEKLLIGRSLTRGLGTGGEVEIGRAAAEADRDAIERLVADTDLVILVVGLGGGTGSAVAPIIAQIAAKTDALVLAFVTLPFSFEGARRKKVAEESIGELRTLVHGLIPLPNDVLLQEGDEDTSVLNAFSVTDKWIGRGINSLCSMLLKTGLINQDFGSLRSVFMDRGGKTVFGTGHASGEEFVKRALEDLFLCPLLHLGDRPATLDKILVNVIGGVDLGIAKVNEIMYLVSKRFGSREDLIFGAVIDESREQSLEICILGKAEMERPVETIVEPKGASPMREMESLDLETEITSHDRPPKPVHVSKLRKDKEIALDQDEFTFIEAEAQRGYFEKTDRNVYNNEDLDVPTYLRRGIKIKIRV